MPTVLFPTLYPSTTELPASDHSQTLQSPPVVLIFHGSYWQMGQGIEDAENALSAAKSILNGQYLSKLMQYGSDGLATFGDTWNTTTTLLLSGGSPTVSTLTTFVAGQIASHPGQIPPGTGRRAPIYVVVNDPQSSGGNSAGYNTFGPPHSIYIGTSTEFPGGPLSIDNFTLTFSHELAEAIASGIRVSDPHNFNQNDGNPFGQIADNEPEFHDSGYFGSPLDGYFVQAYWSQEDHAWVVPDGSGQSTTRGRTPYTQYSITVTNNSQATINLTVDGSSVTLSPGSSRTFTESTLGTRSQFSLSYTYQSAQGKPGVGDGVGFLTGNLKFQFVDRDPGGFVNLVAE